MGPPLEVASLKAERGAPDDADHPQAPTPGAPEKTSVRRMFDRIAPRYDLLNRLLSAGVDVRWRRTAVDLLRIQGRGRFLDLCSGTADLLVEALSRHEGLSGLGVDLSEAMLSRGRAKLEGRSLEHRAAVLSGDAEALPVKSGLFDGAAVAFGIRNVSDTEAAFREVWRVLKPGGRFVILEFSMPKGLLGTLYAPYFNRVLPAVGGLLSGDRKAYAYLPASVARFPPPEELCLRLEGVGFSQVAFRPLTFGIAHLYWAEKPL